MKSFSDLPLAVPETVGMSSERLSYISPVMQRYVDNHEICGAVTLVARHGKVVHLEASGFKEVDQQEKMSTDTIFRVASLTKPIVSLALMMLMEEGKLQIHDPVSKYIPSFNNMEIMIEDGNGGFKTIPAKRQINIRHLLTHTAGFVSDFRERLGGLINKKYFDIAKPVSREGTIADFVDRLAQTPLAFEPGAEWEYSRATCVVGRLVEVISGKNLNNFLQERIFDPLGMVDTHFFLPHEKLSRFSACYKPDANGKITLADKNTTDSSFTAEDSELFVGSGGLVSTVSDYFKFTEMLRRKGTFYFANDTDKPQKLVSRKTIEFMLHNHIGKRFNWITGPGHGFGLGFSIVEDPGAAHSFVSQGSYSWFGMYCTHWWNDPKEQLCGMVFTQLRPFDHLNIRWDMQSLATQAIID
ncbi:MAG: serine hydrolase domain-containing protein [Cellvibrionaceae bacterium]